MTTTSARQFAAVCTTLIAVSFATLATGMFLTDPADYAVPALLTLAAATLFALLSLLLDRRFPRSSEADLLALARETGVLGESRPVSRI